MNRLGNKRRCLPVYAGVIVKKGAEKGERDEENDTSVPGSVLVPICWGLRNCAYHTGIGYSQLW
jgi:hypothetical protein